MIREQRRAVLSAKFGYKSSPPYAAEVPQERSPRARNNVIRLAQDDSADPGNPLCDEEEILQGKVPLRDPAPGYWASRSRIRLLRSSDALRRT
jgi:hypothetical protein